MASSVVEKVVKMKQRKDKTKGDALSKEEVYSLIRALSVVFPIEARPVFTRANTNRRPCYTRGQIMLIHDEATEADVIEEFAHALTEARLHEGMKPHSPAFHRAMGEIMKAYKDIKR